MNLRQKKWVLLIILLGLAATLGGYKGWRVVFPPAPIAPSNPTATLRFPQQINLTWNDNSTTEKGFYVYRKSNSYAKVASLAANTTLYNDADLSHGTTYWYKVTAYNDGGESEASNEASATTSSGADWAGSYGWYTWNLSSLEFGAEWETIIEGLITNTSCITLNYKIRGEFFDLGDILVDTNYVYLENVSVDETRQYEISYHGEEIKRVEVSVDYY